MLVQIKFDSEAESVEEIQKVIDSLKDIVEKKKTDGTKHQSSSQSQNLNNGTAHTNSRGQTSGGGKIIPYEDMSGVLAGIWSKQKC